MKKLITCIIIIITINASNIFAETKTMEFTTPAYILMDKDSGRIVMQKNAFEKRYIASLTKVLTSIVVLENAKTNEIVDISGKAAGIGGSTVGVIKGAKVSVNDLMYSLLLCSGNDAAIALAEHVGGSLAGFSNLMNAKAKEIGANSSHFVTPHGLDNVEHFSTCYDMAKITAYALNNKYIRKIITTKTATVNLGSHSKTINNTNRLVKNFPYATGVKTGFTNGANKCLIGSAKKDDMEFIAVVLGNESTDNRFGDCQKLLEYGLENYHKVDLTSIMKWYVKLEVFKGKEDRYKSYEEGNLIYPLTEGEEKNLVVVQDLLTEIKAPAKKGMKLGEIRIELNNEVIYTKEVFLQKDIEKKQIKDYMLEGVKNIFNLDIEF